MKLQRRAVLVKKKKIVGVKEDTRLEVVLKMSGYVRRPRKTVAVKLSKRGVNNQPHPKTHHLHFSLATIAATLFYDKVRLTAQVTNRHEEHCFVLVV
jgi:hypothetical protein